LTVISVLFLTQHVEQIFLDKLAYNHSLYNTQIFMYELFTYK